MRGIFEEIHQSFVQYEELGGDAPLDATAFLSSMHTLSKVFEGLGGTMEKLLKDDVNTKVASVKEVFATHTERETIDDLMDDEIAKNLQDLPYSPNATRHIFRLLWSLDFTCTLLQLLAANDRPSLKSAARSAYGDVLAPRHTWIVRTAVSAAFNFLPSREAFFDRVGLCEEDIQDGGMEKVVSAIDSLRHNLQKKYDQRKLTKKELP